MESLVGDNVLSYQEEDFTLFEEDSSKENLLEVVGENSSNNKEQKDNEIIVDKDY